MSVICLPALTGCICSQILITRHPSVIALLLWAYVSSFILILGAELSSEYGRMRSGVDRGRQELKALKGPTP